MTALTEIRQEYATRLASGWRRILLLIAGWTALLFGMLGVLLPILPTAPFLIVALLCFARSEPVMLERMFRMPVVGAYLRDWQEGRDVSRSLKWTALAALWTTAIWTFLVVAKTAVWKMLVLLLAVAASIHLLLMPTAGSRSAKSRSPDR